MFTARPRGSTLRRDQEALVHPHPGYERFDRDFPTVMKCNLCHKHVMAPRSIVMDEMKDHWANHCSARHTKADEVREARILYPRQ